MNNNDKSGIYCIENIVNNKKYIGQSKHVHERWKKHVYELDCGKHYNDYLQKSWDKYGKENFKFSVLEYCDIENLDNREIYWISYYSTLDRNKGYNLKSGGQFLKNIYTDELRRKISKSIKESYSNQELRNLRSNFMTKRWEDPKYLESMSGENNPMYGKHHSEEAKKKMSENRKGIPSATRNRTNVFCIELNKIFDDATTAAKELSIDSSGILKVCRKERKTCGGYHWEFINN